MTNGEPRQDARSAAAWRAVVGSGLALVVGNGPLILFTFGVLVGPITAEFGWGRATLAGGIVLSHVTGALMMPIIGAAVDRFGVRRVTLPAIVLFAAILGAMSLLPGTPTAFLAAYALLGLVGAGHSTLPYARTVSAWFREGRGLALGVTLAGVGIGAALMPQAARLLVETYGWRGAYVGLAVILVMVAAPAVALLVRDPAAGGETAMSDGDGAQGLTLPEALKDLRFWALGLALLLVAGAVNGAIAHIVPLLNDRGVSTQAATAALSASGLALIVGRVISGVCLDRFFAPVVAALFFLVPLCGIALLSAGAAGPTALLAAVLLGIGIGAEIDIMAFLVARYFGLLHYGKIYGVLLMLFTFGSGGGPWLIAKAYDSTGTYTGALIGAGVALGLSALLVLRLGRYRFG